MNFRQIPFSETGLPALPLSRKPSSTVLVCASLVTVVAARVRKRLSSNRDKLPLIAALAKGELDYPMGVAVTDLTVGLGRPESVQPLPPVPTTNCLRPRAASSIPLGS